MTSIVDALLPHERRAVALVGLMIRMHGGKDGEGAFAGLGRYAVLTAGLRLCAEQSRSAGGNDLQRLHGDIHDAAFIGLRAEESPQRRMTLFSCRTPGLPQFVYRMASGRLRICPLARWRTEDVGAYIVARRLPLLAAYREEGLETRTTARLTGTAVRMGALVRLKMHHPDQYQIIIARWPELGHLQ